MGNWLCFESITEIKTIRPMAKDSRIVLILKHRHPGTIFISHEWNDLVGKIRISSECLLFMEPYASQSRL